MSKAVLERTLSSALRELGIAKLSLKKALSYLEEVYDATRDRDYLTYIDIMNKLLRDVSDLESDIDYELSII